MSARRRLNADTIRVDSVANVIFYYNAYDRLGSISQNLTGQSNQTVHLLDEALDDLYEALKKREAHKQFLAAKYGENA
jgi:phosphoglycerol transferase MdoB-like AlkP superfamily enzyme